ncbi:response regulator [Kribbella sp. VKM Ac-2568]|uniref:response regulator n=1 Tax=Kribbella sp. VKM Ac-2568 TaxID=2512219 RepID=UPI001F545B2E|nr:response regulator [Kribbella sp. VKM Ac-2568]
MSVSGVGRRILVVEDEPVINQAVTDRLRGSGYEVVQAWDGPGAVARFAETAPDLVLLDVMLPGFDGHEVCRQIQAGRPVPVLMLTARDDRGGHPGGIGRRRRRLPHEALPDAGTGGPGRRPSPTG